MREDLEVSSVYPAFCLNLTFFIAHSFKPDTILATTQQGLYELNRTTCVALLISEEAGVSLSENDQCYNPDVVLSDDIINLQAIESVDFSAETALPSSTDYFREIQHAILLADRDNHCIHLYDLDTRRYQVFLGKCGTYGTVATSGTYLQYAELLNPSDIKYLNPAQNSEVLGQPVSYGSISIYRPCYSAEFNDNGCYTWCDLKPYSTYGNYNQVTCYAHDVVLLGTNSGTVKSAYLFDSNNQLINFLIYNDKRVNLVHHDPDQEMKASIKSIAFIDQTAFLVTMTDNLFRSNLTEDQSDDKMYREGNIRSHYYNNTYIKQGYSLLRSFTPESIVAYHQNFNEIHQLKVRLVPESEYLPDFTANIIEWPRPAKLHSIQTVNLGERACNTFSSDTYHNSTMESCAYTCVKSELCTSFSVDSLRECKLYDGYIEDAVGHISPCSVAPGTTCYRLLLTDQ